nr:PF04480 family protein [uncultured Mediterranean phage uvMED]
MTDAKATKQCAGSAGERALAAQLHAAGVPFEQEQVLIPGRKFRFDFLLSDTDLIVEVEGGTWRGGRHTTGAGFAKDCEKYNLALEHGYRVLRYTTNMVTDGSAVAQIVPLWRRKRQLSVQRRLL